MDDAILRATRCARRYRELGLSPLPSATTRKMPILSSYAEHREAPLPESHFREWGSPNIQLMTGAAYGPTKILVVDCDGSQAQETWDAICRHHSFTPRTWRVKTGGGGWHWYFRIPEGVTGVVTGLIWGVWDTWGRDGKGDWAKHQEIRILGDSALAVAPPSIHVSTGIRYEFVAGSSPKDEGLSLPEIAPAWLLAMPRLSRPVMSPPKNVFTSSPQRAPGCPVGRRRSREAVLSSVPDKVALAVSWGLRLNGSSKGQTGWVSCYAPGRDDRDPSGSICVENGVYRDHRDQGVSVSLFDLGVLLGKFGDWKECVVWCGEKFP